MKPTGWNKLSFDQKRALAVDLWRSTRGRYIISQALFVAAEDLKRKKYPETSNIQDMEMLLETLFPIYAIAKEAEKKFKKLKSPSSRR